jgi:hypothetical protein
LIEPWSILVEHTVRLAEASLDAETFEMLAFEDVLVDERIEFGYDPYRPGEGGYSGRSFDQPIRMMVRTQDLSRAQSLLEEFRSAPFDFSDIGG